MHVREQSEKFARFQGDSLLLEQLLAVQLPEAAAFCEKCGDDVLVFLREQAAGRVNRPPAGLHEIRRRAQDRGLLELQLLDRLRRLAPLEIGIAAQRAEPAARSVHQHPVDLAGEALYADVVFAADRLRVYVGEPGTLEPGFQTA